MPKGKCRVTRVAHDWVGLRCKGKSYELNLKNDYHRDPKAHKEEVKRIKKLSLASLRRSYRGRYGLEEV